MQMLDHKCRLVLFAGPNGSGKSTVTKRIGKHNLLPELYLNPDDIAREINPGNSWEARIAAGRKAVQLRKSYLEENKSFAMETTLSGASEISFIKDAISRGYKVTAIYVAIRGTMDNIARVETRVAKEEFNELRKSTKSDLSSRKDSHQKLSITKPKRSRGR